MRKTREKIRKGNALFWIVIILFVVLAIYCFVEGIIVENKAPWFMASFTSLVALFTSLLWSATKKYAETTEGLLNQSEQTLKQSKLLTQVTEEYTEATKELLKQSKRALEQSRISFLVDIVDRTIEHLKREEDLYKHQQAQAVEYIEGKTKGINRISKEVALEFLDAMIDWSREGGLIKTKLEEFKKGYFGQS